MQTFTLIFITLLFTTLTLSAFTSPTATTYYTGTTIKATWTGGVAGSDLVLFESKTIGSDVDRGTVSTGVTAAGSVDYFIPVGNCFITHDNMYFVLRSGTTIGLTGAEFDVSASTTVLLDNVCTISSGNVSCKESHNGALGCISISAADGRLDWFHIAMVNPTCTATYIVGKVQYATNNRENVTFSINVAVPSFSVTEIPIPITTGISLLLKNFVYTTATNNVAFDLAFKVVTSEVVIKSGISFTLTTCTNSTVTSSASASGSVTSSASASASGSVTSSATASSSTTNSTKSDGLVVFCSLLFLIVALF
jgi:hypothetical protein